ncbi:MAG: hypothetical protein ACO1N3_04075 [Gammaproteobacteria bacterium]
MQLTIDLHLKTREVYQLFEIKISDKRFFMDAVLRKINRIDLLAPEIQLQIEQDLRSLITEFAQKSASLEKMLNKNIKVKSVNIIPQFYSKLTVTNKQGLLLVEFIEIYDKLISLIKLLHLAACFDSDEAYYANLRHVKKDCHRMLSQILITAKTEKHM